MNFYKNTPRSVHISNEAFEGRVLLEWGGGVNYSKIPFFLFKNCQAPKINPSGMFLGQPKSKQILTIDLEINGTCNFLVVSSHFYLFI